MLTKITKTDIDWVDIKNECRNTVNKEATDNYPSIDFMKNLLISEHSPIRLARIKWRWTGIKSWISVHFARHWLGWDKWVSTQRTDRTGVDRNKSPQDTPVNMDIEANAQALINVSRYRLCYQASPETRQYMEDLKLTIESSVSEPIAFAMQPNCVYRCGCPEFKSCGYWDKLVSETEKRNPDINWMNIDERYKAANDYFRRRKDKENS